MEPTLRQLRTFLTIGHAGHVTRAARQLNLTQPAVTHQMRQLEAAIGVALFRRDGRAIALTPEGEALFAELAPMLGSFEAMLGRFRRAGALAGVVRIATLQSYNASVVVAAAALLAVRHPGIRLVSREMPAAAIETAVINGEADIGLTFQFRRGPGLRAELLAREHLFAAAASGTARRFGEAVGLKALQDFPLALMPREFALRALIDDWASTQRLTLNIAFESSNLSALLAYAARTGAVAIIPHFATPGAGGVVIRRLDDDLTRQLSAITPSGPRSELVRAAVATLAEAARALADEGVDVKCEPQPGSPRRRERT